MITIANRGLFLLCFTLLAPAAFAADKPNVVAALVF